MKPAISREDILTRVKDVEKLTGWSPVPLGSVLRVSEYAYPNWGILADPANLEWLYNESQNAYLVEWQDTDDSLNKLVGHASKKAGLGDVNDRMNQRIGKEAAGRLVSSNKTEYSIADIGAGTGATSLAVAQSIAAYKERILSLDFVLIEPSPSRLAVASEEIRKLARDSIHVINVRCIADTDIGALRKQNNGSFDIAVANASLHHNSFTKHFAEIARTLRAGAPFVVGDWYDGLSERPARVYWMLALISKKDDDSFIREVLTAVENRETIGVRAKTPELDDFRGYFSLADAELKSAFMANGMKQALADAGILRFWLEVGKIFAEKKAISPIYMLEGHERVGARRNALKQNRFYFDEDCRVRYKELLKKRKGELAAVMVAKKARTA